MSVTLVLLKLKTTHFSWRRARHQSGITNPPHHMHYVFGDGLVAARDIHLLASNTVTALDIGACGGCDVQSFGPGSVNAMVPENRPSRIGGK